MIAALLLLAAVTVVDGSKLAAFTARYQDVAPELVIASLRSRYEIFCEAQDCCVDLEKDAPSIFDKLATQALTPEDFYVFDEPEA